MVELEVMSGPPELPHKRRGWKSNVIFIALCVIVVAMVIGTLLDSRAVAEPEIHDIAEFQAEEFRQTVAKLDAAFETHWEEQGLTPTAAADHLAIARRLSLGLTGVIPSLEEVRALELQSEGDHVQWFLSHLFEDERYGDFVAERFARAYVGTDGGAFLVFRRRRMVHWLAEEFRGNRHYDELVRSMITAEGIWTSKPEGNFITGAIEQDKGVNEEVLTARFSRAFLGIRMDCMQCHEDFMGGEWLQEDFHQLAAFFGQTENSVSGIRDQPKNKHMIRYRGKTDEVEPPAKVPFYQELLPKDGSQRERIAAWCTHPNNDAFARTAVNRVWAIMFGRPLVEPIDDLGLEGPWPPGLELLAADLVEHEFDLQRLMRIIAASRVFQLDSRSDEVQLTAEHDANWANFPLTRLRPEQMARSIAQTASLATIDAESHIIRQLQTFGDRNNFVERYGDQGVEEFEDKGGTIPQRLIMMNGDLVRERTENNVLMNASARIAMLAAKDDVAVETAYLAILTRLPTADESEHFVKLLGEKVRGERGNAMQDLYWSLLNSTEFSWNH